MRYKLPYCVFAILLFFWLFYTIIPLIRIFIPTLAEINLNLDPSSLGLATLLIITSFALILFEKIPMSAILQKLKISGSGVEAIFRELQEADGEIGEEEISDTVKFEVEEIRESDRDPKAVFLELVIEIERKVNLLAEKHEKPKWRYIPVRKVVDILLQYNVIDLKLGNLIKIFWDFRNRVIHGRIEMTTGRLDEVINIGERILSKLEKA